LSYLRAREIHSQASTKCFILSKVDPRQDRKGGFIVKINTRLNTLGVHENRFFPINLRAVYLGVYLNKE
jgi:hypothetical protein